MRARGPAVALSALAGAAGLVGSLIGFAVEPRRALHSWLFAWAYWGGTAVAALLLLCIFHASRARWSVVFRRAVETMAGTLPLLAVLFLPVLAGVAELYPWAAPGALGARAAALLAHQRPYMNPALFLVRAVAYFAVWIAVSELLLRWSRRQDGADGLTLTRRLRRLGVAGLPLSALALSFAALDWLMSLDPTFTSSIFPLYWFTGSFLAALALLTLWVTSARGAGGPGARVNPAHLASLGKLLLGFTLFWGYVAYCDWLLIWIANLPGEVPWFLVRTSDRWAGLAVALVGAQLVLPFLVLLSRPLKQRPGALGAVAAWIALAHALDLYWVVLPAADPAGPSFRWTDLAAFAGVGGLAVAFALHRFRAAEPVPARDPYLPDSMRYAGR